MVEVVVMEVVMVEVVIGLIEHFSTPKSALHLPLIDAKISSILFVWFSIYSLCSLKKLWLVSIYYIRIFITFCIYPEPDLLDVIF